GIVHATLAKRKGRHAPGAARKSCYTVARWGPARICAHMRRYGAQREGAGHAALAGDGRTGERGGAVGADVCRQPRRAPDRSSAAAGADARGDLADLPGDVRRAGALLAGHAAAARLAGADRADGLHLLALAAIHRHGADLG